jgi:hypothetical protein
MCFVTSVLHEYITCCVFQSRLLLILGKRSAGSDARYVLNDGQADFRDQINVVVNSGGALRRVCFSSLLCGSVLQY